MRGQHLRDNIYYAKAFLELKFEVNGLTTISWWMSFFSPTNTDYRRQQNVIKKIIYTFL
jgi:hypothetical protein